MSEIKVGDRVRFIGETWEALKTGEEGYVTKVRNVTFAPKPFAFVRFDDHDVDTFANQCDLELVASATASADEAQAARLATVADAAFIRQALQAIRDYAFHTESNTVNAGEMEVEELLAGAGAQAVAALEADHAGAALLERLTAAESRVKALETALEEVDDVATQAQGEWSGVEEPYAPEWTLGYKGVRDVVADALKGDE